ncbi:hypothetical protein RCO27_14460 [Sphingosinicella sp. LHD-64]|uniref:hypothetical protein n=1 Tax=Sphingosinicella sp. LHD-64 TaxID=3072139 RepID=UPI00280D59C3|nr:hypothetical protein [Sphingosinicella sp. LHD-64]MDQ8757430.1 hypothetical protein [Sphingosinicella sp. LHD-64]
MTGKSSLADGPPPNVHLWSREGFLGANAIGLQPGYTPDYESVEGLHAPRRLAMEAFVTADMSDPDALPTPILMCRTHEVTISVSRRREPMAFTLRNVEADELHFMQRGGARFDTEFGSIEGGEGDFVCIPRSCAYRMTPLSGELVDVILESAGAYRFDTPAPFGMINFGMDLRRAAISPMPPQMEPSAAGHHVLVLKALDGLTRFVKPVDPLPAIVRVGGETPVWALNIAAVQPVSYGGLGGPPAQFLTTPRAETLLYTLSSRQSKLRPPVHHNADYDEFILFFRGPGSYGELDQPGSLSHVPKGVTHHGPTEDVPEGYLAWLLETRATMRFTPEALAQAKLMETGAYGVHPSER